MRPATGIRAGAAVGVGLLLLRRGLNAAPTTANEALVRVVERLVTSQGELTNSLERRLQALEETSARAEAEIRFVSSVVGVPGVPVARGDVGALASVTRSALPVTRGNHVASDSRGEAR